MSVDRRGEVRVIPKEVIPRRVVTLVKITRGGRHGKWAWWKSDDGFTGRMRLYLWDALKPKRTPPARRR